MKLTLNAAMQTESGAARAVENANIFITTILV